MPETIADLAREVRSKNAGPFWITMEIFLRDDAGYALVADPAFLDTADIARLYRIDADTIAMFRIPELRVVKISFPRPVSQAACATGTSTPVSTTCRWPRSRSRLTER